MALFSEPLLPELPAPVRGGVRQAVFRAAEAGARASARYHRARLLGGEHLPREGAALLVGNHGLWGYETPAFFSLVQRASGRYPVGLAEHGFFRIPLVRTVLPWLGGVPGTRESALAQLSEGRLVVCYPGGARETFKPPHRHYMLRWERSLGFARLAAEAQVPVLPFAGYGVDDTFLYPGDGQLGVQLAPEEKYRMPLVMPLPLPVRLSFALGAPLEPPPRGAPEAQLAAFRDRVAARVRWLLAEACHG
ncbi:acyltransferase family protein [Aggregicoccus sp. 17bor-14]|uniref:lysophospholipid acyltransferase family protein n=1 Tax=Myxococcaceae TaxID=31 RepID=UPI00129CE79D|nr:MULTISPECIES: lysophospholipid acyltransferase family protein [Myxococcaceae]MBF5045390.1 acyltransferase family protein [Simulacricoccus sp. 17bor-14]MRI91131.1 acyltransferase family protein [Aggregicoccus sp. 17bor-14]